MTIERTKRVGATLMALFALSGFAGLIYESIWTQYLGLFLGHAAYAQSFVLVLFMGGMAIGAWLASRKSSELGRPLAVYAAIELAVGLLGVAFDPIYRVSTDFAYAHIFPALGGGAAIDIVRYALAVLLIGPQCILLGATFPLMSAGYIRLDPERKGYALSGLYFSNSFGAAIGALLATFVLLPAVGLPGTVLTGGLVSIVVAVLVWPLGKDITAGERPGVEAAGSLTPSSLVMLVALLTGATSFVYEITWVRMLALALGSTLHAFELMLAAFISGIAFGGLWLRSRADKWTQVLGAVGWIQILMGVAAFGSLFVYLHAFDWVSWLVRAAGKTPQAYALFNAVSGAICLAVMFPAAFFAGMTLPLLTLTQLRANAGERAIGRIYAANTVGAIIGVLITVHLLMPLIGVRLALWVAAAADLALGAALLVAMMPRASRWRPQKLAGIAVACLIGLVALVETRVDPLTLASSVYRSGSARLPNDSSMIFYGDGKTASVALYETPGAAQHRSIATNGKVDAALNLSSDVPASPDEFTMMLAGALPLALKPHPDNVAVIGFGSGMTVNTLLGSKRVKQVDVIEIEPLMVQAARHFEHRVARAFSDGRSHIVYDDAKAYMAGHKGRYDIIVSEPSNPWVGGTATLFSEQFYDFIPSHLASDGIFVQWLQLYEITPELVASVLKAMLPRFGDVRAYVANNADILLVATPAKQLPALGPIEDTQPGFQAELERLGVRDSKDLDNFYVLDKRGLQALAASPSVLANSDYFPVLQLQAPKARFMKASAGEINQLQVGPWPLLEATTGYAPATLARPLNPVKTSVSRDEPTRTAREVRRILLNDGVEAATGLPTEIASKLTLVQALIAANQIDKSPDQWLESATEVAASTIPYLDVVDAKQLWAIPAWMGNARHDDPRVAAALAYWSAMAARDWSTVAREGGALLQTKEWHGTPAFAAYVLGGTELAELMLGHSTTVADLERDYGRSIKGLEFERHWLMTLAGLANTAPKTSMDVNAPDS